MEGLDPKPYKQKIKEVAVTGRERATTQERMGERTGVPEACIVSGIFRTWKNRGRWRGSIPKQGQTASEVWCQENMPGPCKTNGETQKSWLGPGDGGGDREQGCETVSSAGVAAHTVVGQALRLVAGIGSGGFSEFHSPNPCLITTL